MFRLLRLTLTTCFLIGFLSLTYEGKPLFDFVYKYSRTIITPIQLTGQDLIKVGYHRTIDFSRQFFNNNLPTKDSVDYQLSAPERQEAESYSSEDEQELEDIFGN